MKLIKAHIVGFGKISDFTYDFHDGLNEVLEENGWGKTTFSIFIKAMFYGLPKTTKSNLEENDRSLYSPIGGGTFGGFIEFEHLGKDYRLERFFGSKATDDIVKLTEISTGKSFPEPENATFGNRLFGINSDAFIRTLFLAQKDVDLSNNKSISDIIGEVSVSSNDIDVDLVVKRLENKVKSYKNSRNAGVIEDIKKQIFEVDKEILRSSSAVDAVNRIDNDIKVKSQQIAEKTVEYNKINELSKKVREVESIKERKILFDEKQNKLNELKNKKEYYSKIFDSSLTRDDFRVLKEKCSEIYYIEEEIEKNKEILSIIKENRQSVLVNYSIPPTKEHLNEFNKYLGVKNEILCEQVEPEIIPNEKPTFNLNLIFLIISLLVTVGGVGLIFVNTIVGVILSVIGFIGLIIFIILFVLKSIKNTANLNYIKSSNSALNAKKEINQAKLTNIETNLLKIKMELGHSALTDDEFIKSLEYSLQRLDELCQTKKAYEDQIIAKKQVLNDKTNQVNLILSKIAVPSEIANLPMKNKVVILSDKFEEFLLINSEIQKLSIEINDLKTKGVEISNEYLSADKNQLDIKERELSNALNALRAELKRLEIDKNDCAILVDRGKELLETKENLQNELSIAQKNYELYSKTLTLFKDARENLTQKYLSPVLTKLKENLKIITGNDCDVVLDANYKGEIRINGQYKSIEYCSKGWKNIFALALRLAFTDTVFEEKFKDSKFSNPFMVFDDPFVNYDEKHLEKALEFMAELSKKRQIIYFTCHSSRISTK